MIHAKRHLSAMNTIRRMCVVKKDPTIIAHEVALAHTANLTTTFASERAQLRLDSKDDRNQLLQVLKELKFELTTTLQNHDKKLTTTLENHDKKLITTLENHDKKHEKNVKEMEDRLQKLWNAHNYRLVGLVVSAVGAVVVIVQIQSFFSLG